MREDLPENTTEPFSVLEVRDLVQEFGAHGETVHAVSGVSFDVERGTILGLVGESGCGKSSTARAVMQEPAPTSGSVLFNGTDLTKITGRSLRQERASMQMVFQDPYSSLNPRWPIIKSVEEPLRVRRGTSDSDIRQRAREMLELVSLDPETFEERRPHELSGGQCQRAAIARALVARPDLVIFDEAVSSLDVSVQAQVLNLLRRIRSDLSLTAIFIGHDLSVISYVCDRVAVMYLGRICEIGPVDQVLLRPMHPYTQALVAVVPSVEAAGRLKAPTNLLRGDLPSPTDPPSGCRFRTRCPMAEAVCETDTPSLSARADGRLVACHFA